jgi:hypothetical protein
MPKRRTIARTIRVSNADLLAAVEHLSRQLTELTEAVVALGKDFRSHDHTQLPGRDTLRLHDSPSGVWRSVAETSEQP